MLFFFLDFNIVFDVYIKFWKEEVPNPEHGFNFEGHHYKELLEHLNNDCA